MPILYYVHQTRLEKPAFARAQAQNLNFLHHRDKILYKYN